MSSSFLNWFSVASLSINIILAVISIALVVVARQERQRRNSQVKIWMEQANGISQALQRIIQDKWNNLYSSVSDVTNAINAVQASAAALWQSLYEERVLTEEEYKEHAMKLRKHLDKSMGLDQEQTANATPAASADEKSDSKK